MPRARPVLSDAPLSAFGKTTPARPVNPSSGLVLAGGAGTPTVDRTYKLYVGGKQVRPDGAYVRPIVSTAGVVLGHVRCFDIFRADQVIWP